MPVAEGKFQLYTSITPPLEAGDWRLVASQELQAQASTGPLTANDLDVEDAKVNFRIRSPRYVMPPDQVLSTFPPANSFGSYGSRLPQVVLKRRTLPWERNLADAPEGTPWLALVLIAEGEARLDTGVEVADCVTAGVVLEGIAEVEKGNCLVVRKSVVDKVFPTRNDVELLTHAREVDISDTELLMGDDDGFLAVVISNRLPVPGKDAEGNEVPVKYLACLVNLEGQFERLLERSPDPTPIFTTEFLATKSILVANASADDHLVMQTAASAINTDAIAADVNNDLIDIEPLESTRAEMGNDQRRVSGRQPLADAQSAGSTSFATKSAIAKSSGTTPASVNSQWTATATAQLSATDIGLQMAADFRLVQAAENIRLDPEYRFPVLMHWSFTTTGSTTFRSLMEGLDSRLLGDVGSAPSALDGRLPLEVVESGHVGLGHKTREGDDVRAWYRGPLVPHPTQTTSGRLPLAHSADQLRIVIPDGREDLSLAAAFEVGRLLSLSQPSVIASLMRWRQGKYHAARLASLIEPNRKFWENVLGNNFALSDIGALGPKAGRFLVTGIAQNPEEFLGQPRPAVTPGRALEVEGLASDILATGLGFDDSVLKGDIGSILDTIREAEVPVFDLELDDLGAVDIREQFEGALDRQRVELVSNALRTQFVKDPITGPAFPVTNEPFDVIVPDVLDAILAGAQSDEDDEQDLENTDRGSQ